jgi:hypothetical protein
MLRKQPTNISPTILLPKAAIGICVAVLLAGSATPPVLAGDETGNNLPTAQIFKKVKDNYALMTTYSDEGCVVIALSESTVINFSTRLARTNFYLIEWNRAGEPLSSTKSGTSQAVWYSGSGDYLQAEAGMRSQVNCEIALAKAGVYSGGATLTVPRLFFNQLWEDEPIDGLVFSVTRQADEKMGDISCYVFARGAMGATNTLWIGQQDFLIHKVRTVISTKVIQAAVFESRIDPGTISMLHGFTWTETHTNIILNKRFSRSDFVPSFPLCQSSEDESN